MTAYKQARNLSCEHGDCENVGRYEVFTSTKMHVGYFCRKHADLKIRELSAWKIEMPGRPPVRRGALRKQDKE